MIFYLTEPSNIFKLDFFVKSSCEIAPWRMKVKLDSLQLLKIKRLIIKRYLFQQCYLSWSCGTEDSTGKEKEHDGRW